MKRGVVVSLALFCLTLAVLALPAASQAGPIVLRYAESGPPAGLGGEYVKIVKEEIEKATDGRVTIEVYWSGSLLKGKEILNGIKTGLVDMGYVLPAYYPKQLFVHNALSLFPVGPVGFEGAHRAMERCLQEIPAFREEMASWNQRVLYMRQMLPMALCSVDPVTGLEDFEGQQIRSSSKHYLAALEALDASPVSIPWSDCYMALQTGTIDGVFTNYDGIFATKLYEPAPHILTAKALWVPMPIFSCINLKRWKSLPEELQSAMLEADEAIVERFSRLYEEEWDHIVAAMKDEGCTVTAASREDIRRFETLPVWEGFREEWAADAAKRGIPDPEEVLEQMATIIAEERRQEN
ncbi:MAG: TRAP transporter substrate-binding protein DctP [Synergistales bacterium]|nr:TRAP transporter substrate-binding protein DctP [Synergistales bacterium]